MADLQVVREGHEHGDDAAEGAGRLPLGEERGDHEGEHDEREAEDLAGEEDGAEVDALDDDELGDERDEERDEGHHHGVHHEPGQPEHWGSRHSVSCLVSSDFFPRLHDSNPLL